MKIDRAYQLELLKNLAEKYPSEIQYFLEEQYDPVLISNAWYLADHGLIKCSKDKFADGTHFITEATITHKGIDFLADDGGLSAILGVVTIKLHEDQLLQLLERRIEAAPGSQTDKNGLIAQLRALPGDSIKHVTMKLLDLGLDKAPDAFQLLRTALESALK